MFTLEEAYEALNGHTEFAVKEYDGVICFDYIVILPGTFCATEEEIQGRAKVLCAKAGLYKTEQDFLSQAKIDCERFAQIRRNFRGITFDAKTGEVLSLPLHKFFNINQNAETQFNLLQGCNAVIYEKLDGSMIHFFIDPQRSLQAATCRGTWHPVARQSLLLAEKKKIKGMILEVIEAGFTPIFEFVAPHNQIVVEYPAPRLVYLVSRHRKTGDYQIHDCFPDRAKGYQFPFAEVFSHLDLEEFEGYVCHLDNGMFVKAKTQWYLDRHHVVDTLMKPAYKLYEVVFAGLMDDLIAYAPDRHKVALAEIYEEAQRDFLNEKLRLESVFETLMEIHEREIAVQPEEKGQEIQELVAAGRQMEAIKKYREIASIGLAEAKRRIQEGIYPQESEAERQTKYRRWVKAKYVSLIRHLYPDDFAILEMMYAGVPGAPYRSEDTTQKIKDRLMEGYKVKYPHKIFADLAEVDI